MTSRDVAILVLTIEGLQHLDGGVGRYVGNIVDEVPSLRAEWLERGVRLSFYVAEPVCRPDMATFRPGRFERIDARLRRAGGRAIRLVSFSGGGDNSFRDPLAADARNYLVGSATAAQVAIELAAAHQALRVLGGNTLFAQVPALLMRQARLFGADVACVHLTHSPVPPPGPPDDPRVAANELLASAARSDPLVRIGYESEFMLHSYRERYGLPERAFVNARSGVPATSPRFAPLPDAEVQAVLQRLRIPMDRPLVVSWGRSDPAKGFDLLLRAARLLDGTVVPVVLNPTFNADLHRLDQQLGTGAVLLHDQEFQVIKALLQWPYTRVAAFLSANEPASVTPAEAMLAAHGSGCVVLTVPTGCYPEMIAHGRTGVMAAARTSEAVASAVREVLALPAPAAREIGANASSYASKRHDFSRNFRRTLAALLEETPHQPRS
jgi:glycosyltransferase involved in cell wall biosynthesis